MYAERKSHVGYFQEITLIEQSDVLQYILLLYSQLITSSSIHSQQFYRYVYFTVCTPFDSRVGYPLIVQQQHIN